MNAADVIREAADCGYSIVEKDGLPVLRGQRPVNPPSLVELCKTHRDAILEEIRRRKDGSLPATVKLPSSKDLQLWVLQLVKSNRNGAAVIDGVPVGIRDEAMALMSDASAWEKHRNHQSWMERASRLRTALEWPLEETER